MTVYSVEDDYDVPEELTKAVTEGKIIQIATVIGWVTLPEPDFRNSCKYRILEKEDV